MIMIKVFKTDVQYAEKAENIVHDLLQKYPYLCINFDLEDEDKIMRIEGTFFRAADIICCLKERGHYCVDLPIDLD
jgi:hypothetical protein